MTAALSPSCRTATETLTTVVLLLAGCATSKPNPPTLHPSPVRIEATGSAFLERAGQPSQPAPLNDAFFVEATGNGFPADRASTPAQKKLTALKAARYGALAKLAEKLQGVQITRNARVQDMVFSGEEITVSLSGVIQGATSTQETYDAASELAEVQLRIALGPDGHIIPQRASRIAPASLLQRKAEAEAAARINAMAALREQIGKEYHSQSIQEKNLPLDSRWGHPAPEGLLESIQFSPPRWTGETQCEVTAFVEITHTKRIEKEVHQAEITIE